MATIAIALLLSGCAADPYPLSSGPPNAGQQNPAAVGEPIHAVLIYLQVRPGDRIELLGGEPIGSIDGASVRFLLSRPVIEDNGVHVIGKEFEDLDGAVVTAGSARADSR